MAVLDSTIWGFSIITWSNAIVVILSFHYFIGIPNLIYLCTVLLDFFKSWRRGKLKASEISKLKSKAYLSTIDDNLHMNNQVYFKYFEEGRRDWFFRVGSYGFLRKYNCNIVLTSITVRFRKEIQILQSFEIHTRLIYYDEYHIYLEQRVIAIRNRMVCTIAYADCAVISNTEKRRAKTNDFIKHLNIPHVNKKKLIENAPSSLLHWIEYLKENSSEIRAESGLLPKKH